LVGLNLKEVECRMKISSFIKFASFGAGTVMFRGRKPIIGEVILTDRCNLSCLHCAVNNITSVIYPYGQIRREMQLLYDQGVRILLFFGGEPFIWQDSGKTLKDLAAEAKEMGFLYVIVVTNGTFPLDLPSADMVMVSLDGGREKHNEIRGDTYDRILGNIRTAASPNICLYMALNKINKDEISSVCSVAAEEPNVRSVSFNFHTPYPGTEHLSLSIEEKAQCCQIIENMMDQGMPVLNLRSAFPYLINNNFPVPCYQCVIIENGKQSFCGRCIDIPGLCSKCGYFFAAEYSLAFQGNIRVIIEMLRTYLKYT
jgi:MoaA/NifB/PqqE/SkfB family radical SAM enzyme